MPPPPGEFIDQIARVAHAQLEWNEYLKTRRSRLKFITEKAVNDDGYDYIIEGKDYAIGEAELEKKLIFSGKGPQKRKVKSYVESSKESWFSGIDMLGGGSPRDTIGLLGLLAAASVGDKFIERYFDDLATNDGAWLHKSQFEGHKADYPLWTAQNDETSLKLQQFHAMVDALAKHPDSPRLWKHLNAMFRLSGYLMKILRFVDEQNAHLGGRPALPDGSNIEEPRVRAAWVLHRAWVRLLHFRSLSLGSRPRGVDQLKNILVIARAQLEEEIRGVPADSRNILEALLGFETTLGTLTLFLKALATEFGEDAVPKPGAQRPYSVSDFNIDADRVGASWSQITQALRPDPLGKVINPLAHMLLWSQLLDRAADFEDKNNRYYVEDHLIDNRILAEDEYWELTKILSQRGYNPDVIKSRLPDAAQEQYVRALARKVSQVNVNRRNFLLLRDWSKKRPWKQLYWVFDTVTTDSWREVIDDFYNTIESLKCVPAELEDELEASNMRARIEADPESEANLFANVFPIHPLPSHDPCKYAGAYFGNCVYCLEDYTPGELWLRFFCDHMVHYDCGRDAWDNPGNPDFRCPLCRQTQSWQLHEVAGIIPEALDLWDNVDLVDAEEVAIHPIVQMEGTPADEEGFKELYWESEAARLNASEAWDIHYYGLPRSLHHEMAQMRNARRKRVLAARLARAEKEKEFPTLAE
ncbi:hypothetical protein OCU04_001865 [Sclerotinia nivalis]|uniref:RING-type domain-containing protein n=1 Tax=Sclerotinia nivalis TaxID=352851 RepID=A0A9X0DPW1_9HELO|nr:hypothetical protein OCU04_001865 [Sclerotinia nivalis]